MNWIDIITLIAALGAAIIAGTFFAFSNFVMPAFARLSDEAGAAVMLAINATVLNPLFLGIFSGTAAVGVIAAIAGIVAMHDGAIYIGIGAVLYAVGTFGVTAARNVPINNALVEAPAGAAAEVWRRTYDAWVRWNTIRTVAALFATASFILALAS